MDSFFDDLLKSKKSKKNQPPTELDKLYEIPLKDKGANKTHFQFYPPNMFYQADILFLPDDNGYKYALVLADVGTRLCDGVALKTKSASEVTTALKLMFKRKIIGSDLPDVVMVDQGTEFKADTKEYLEGLGIFTKVNVKDRHKQNAIVERVNQKIGTLVHKRQTAQELLTGETSRAWKDDLPAIIKAINKKVKLSPVQKLADDPTCSGTSCDLLKVGDRVRVALEVPEDVASGKKLHGKFRSSDIRWNREIRTIKEVVINVGQPPLYLLNAKNPTAKVPFEPVGYTKNELQPVGKDEVKPNHEHIRPEADNVYVIDSIVDKKLDKKKVLYKVHWKGYPSSQDTWEPEKLLIEDVPDEVEKYNNKEKKKKK